MKGLTTRQQQVLDAIRTYMHANQMVPTVREIGEVMEMRSSCTVQRHLEALERKGYIRRGTKGESRSIRLIDGPCPVCGQATYSDEEA